MKRKFNNKKQYVIKYYKKNNFDSRMYVYTYLNK